MPRSPHISSIDYQRLVVSINSTFGHSVSSISDAINLSTKIESTTGVLLSLNTIRRFFGLIDTTSSPTQETLNIFSRYCGFNSFYDFQKSQKQSSFEHTLSFNTVCDLYNTVSSDKEFFKLLSWLIQLAFKEGNYTFLTRVFDLEVFKKGYDYTNPQLWDTVISLGVEMRRNPNGHEILSKYYAQIPTAQSLYFELFVDHDLLPTRHYKAIVDYSKNKTNTEAKVFSNSLLFLKSLMVKDFSSCDTLIKRINQQENNTSLHPYPTARKTAYTLIHNHFIRKPKTDYHIKSVFSIEETMPREGKLNRNVPLYHVVVAEALAWCGKYDEALELINIAFQSYGCLQSPKSVAENAAFNKLNTYYAKCLFEVGNKKKANEVFNKVDTNSFDIQSREFDSMHYYKIGYDLVKGEDVTKARLFKKQVANISQAYGFTFFRDIYE